VEPLGPFPLGFFGSFLLALIIQQAGASSFFSPFFYAPLFLLVELIETAPFPNLWVRPIGVLRESLSPPTTTPPVLFAAFFFSPPRESL